MKQKYKWTKLIEIKKKVFLLLLFILKLIGHMLTGNIFETDKSGEKGINKLKNEIIESVNVGIYSNIYKYIHKIWKKN